MRVPIQDKGFVKGQKTFHPRISIKTPENRLILSGNQEFHPNTDYGESLLEKDK